MRSLFSVGFLSFRFMAHPELLSSLSEEEIRKCQVLLNPFSCVFKKSQHWLLSIVYAFTKIPFFKKIQIHAYHYFNKTSIGQMNCIELEKK